MEPVFSGLRYAFDFARQEEELQYVDGFLQSLEGYSLMLLASEGPGTGEIVEIGSYMGRSTCFLAKGSKAMRRENVTAVDHFTGSPEHQEGASSESQVLITEGTTFNRFKASIEAADVSDYVTPINTSSEEAVKDWDKPIRLLFIDGDHSYEESRKDFELWAPFIIPGGVVCFHDINTCPGVTQFYNELINTTTKFEPVFTVLSLAAIRRKHEAPAQSEGRAMREELLGKIRQAHDYFQCRLDTATIEGDLHPVEGSTLLQLAARGPGVGAIVELGGAPGRSTCYLARGSKRMDREKVSSIDPFKEAVEPAGGEASLATFTDNLRSLEVDDHVTLILTPSVEAAKEWTEPIRLLVLDGRDSYEMSKQLFDLWAPFVVTGGIICLRHVQTCEGVTQLHKELINSPAKYETIVTANALAVLRKKG